ncbi:DUF882 domain-containing protein [Pseudomonas aeruginosa]|uniref:DUF882 domain-containing protein n=1 Tax=Pseudomonas aeruginosa TaxID=287 RepID=UPI002852F21D|nr:DUF882 domain-containing protein [Pseudomonas aeruginosa]
MGSTFGVHRIQALKPSTITRRQLLAAFLAAPAALTLGQALGSVPSGRKYDWRVVALNRDRWLDLERPDSGEKASFCYFRGGKGWDVGGYQKACSILRDVKFKSTVRMSPKLLDLLYLIQVWLRINRLPYKILVNSGYRTPQHNSKLEAQPSNHFISRRWPRIFAYQACPSTTWESWPRLLASEVWLLSHEGIHPCRRRQGSNLARAESTVLEPEHWIVELLDPSTDAQWLANLAPDWPELEMLA